MYATADTIQVRFIMLECVIMMTVLLRLSLALVLEVALVWTVTVIPSLGNPHVSVLPELLVLLLVLD